ncbi:MAG: Patatin [Caulobacteraceae bacterium]|nr:Patatin [Caulobacteraceae bacterium]
MVVPSTDRAAERARNITLVLQGGGALGAYQAGVYEALAQAGQAPAWVAGISIGAINAALIAGNAPERRVERLRAFWEQITAPSAFWPASGAYGQRLCALNAMMFGQPGFFAPHPPYRWLGRALGGAAPPSLYDTAALRTTLERLVDFDRINARETRFSVAAVNVRTGALTWFDNAEATIRPEHVMASGALPPGFPAVEIDGEAYWDGGLVSNTPLQYVMESVPRRSRLIFQVDLFAAEGAEPRDLEAVSERERDIRYASKALSAIDLYRGLHDVRHRLNELIEQLPPDLRQTQIAQYLYAFGCVTTMDIVAITYRPPAAQGPAKDYAFGRGAMLRRWAQGLADAEATLATAPWRAPMPPEVGARAFDVLADLVSGASAMAASQRG